MASGEWRVPITARAGGRGRPGARVRGCAAKGTGASIAVCGWCAWCLASVRQRRGGGAYLKVVEHPGVLEGALTELGGLLLELLDGTLVDTTALVDKVTGGGRLAGIDVADDDEVHVSLFLSHGEGGGVVWTTELVLCKLESSESGGLGEAGDASQQEPLPQ